MNDIQVSTPDAGSIPDNAQLAQWRDEAEAAVTAPDLATPDLYERVRELTARALHDRRMTLVEVREIVSAITTGVGSGLSSRGGEMKDGLKQAVSGLDAAFGSAAQAASLSWREAISQGKSFKDTELKSSHEQLGELETQIVDTLKQTAKQSGGKLKEELEYLSDHLKVSGTRTGEEVRGALRQMAEGIKVGGVAGRAGLAESSSVASERLSLVASGVLAALSDSLKRQSERLRS